MYYGKAINGNGNDLREMRTVWPIYFDKLLTNEKLGHHLCPSISDLGANVKLLN